MTALKTQLRDYFEYVDERQDAVDVTAARERKLGTGFVRPVQPAGQPKRFHVPRIAWVAAGVLIAAAVLIPLLFFVDRSTEPDVATTVPNTVVTTLPPEVTTTVPPDTGDASALPPVWDLPSFTDAGWEWAETTAAWPAFEFGRLGDGTWVAYSTGYNCESDGEYYLGRPGGGGDTTTGCWGDPVGDPLETIYFSEDGRTWQSQVVDLWESPTTYPVWFGEHLLVGPGDPSDPTGWLAFDGSDWVEIAGPNFMASNLHLGGLVSFLEFEDQALLVFRASYLFDADPRVPVNDLAIATTYYFGVTPVEGMPLTMYFAGLKLADGIVGDTVKEACPTEEPYCGLINMGGPFASMMSGDREEDLQAFQTLFQNARSSFFMFRGQWHVVEWLAEGGPALWRSGDLRNWDRLGTMSGLPVPSAFSGFSGGVVEFDGSLVYWYEANGTGYYAVSGDGLAWTELEVPRGFGDSIPAPGSVAVIGDWLIIDPWELSPIATRDLETWYRVDNAVGIGSTGVSLLGDPDGAPTHRVLGASIDQGGDEGPVRWVAIPPGE